MPGDAERFAAAIEQGTPPGSVADPELARDLEIAAMLSVRGDAFAPRPDEKARARRQLMARLAQLDDAATAPDDPTTVIPIVAPVATLVAGEPGSGDTPLGRPGRRRNRHRMPTSRPAGHAAARGLRKRVVLIGAAALVAVIAVAGGGIFASRNALPGDVLYGVKRVAESAGLAMTFDDAARARRQLELASTRLGEVEQLAARGPATTDPELFQSTMKDFDDYTGAGSRTLLASDDAGGAAALGDLRAWAGEQVARLSVLRSALPAPVVPGADSSISLLDRLLGRAEALGDRSSCTQVTSGVVDDLGPLPAEGTCTPRPADPAAGGAEGRSDRTGVAGTGTPDGSAATGGGDASVTPDTSPSGAARSGGTGAVPDPASTGSEPTTTSAPSGGDSVPVPLPLPLLPPIQLPPLVPGQPGVTIG